MANLYSGPRSRGRALVLKRKIIRTTRKLNIEEQEVTFPVRIAASTVAHVSRSAGDLCNNFSSRSKKVLGKRLPSKPATKDGDDLNLQGKSRQKCENPMVAANSLTYPGYAKISFSSLSFFSPSSSRLIGSPLASPCAAYLRAY